MTTEQTARKPTITHYTAQSLRDYWNGITLHRRRAQWERERHHRIEHYLKTHTITKLHLGAGRNPLQNWLNTDRSPRRDDILYLDITAPLPFADTTFEYIFNEHLLEHLSYPQGQAMLAQCKRVLRPGGTIRIATPNLQNLILLFDRNKTTETKHYIEWAMTFNHLPRTGTPECFILNNFLRSWGHQFIYDEHTLHATLEAAGFTNITTAAPRESHDPHLQQLEGHADVIGEENNRFETMILEAKH